MVGNLAVRNLVVKNFAVGTFGGQDFLRSGHFPVCIFFNLGGLINNFLSKYIVNFVSKQAKFRLKYFI